MKFRTGLLVGAALGYYYGAKAGRERYEQIDRGLDKLRSTSTYQSVAGQVGDRVGMAKDVVRDRAGSVAGGALGSVLGEEPSWEPGLEFNPDYRPSEEEILADFRGEPDLA